MVATHHISNDFDGDGKSDVLFQMNNGRTAAWLGTSSGAFITDSPVLQWPGGGASSWSIVATGDFNGDGRADVMQQNWEFSFLLVEESISSGGFLSNWDGALSLPQDWSVAGAGDFNGDGISDVLFRSTTGAISNWLGGFEANTVNVAGDPVGQFTDNVANAGNSVSADWQIAGIGDFNGDGRDDILWRNVDGRLTDWLGTANGGYQPNSPNLLDTVSTDWKVVGIGDFNHDGKADILWRNEDGRITDWLGTNAGAFTDNVVNAYNSVSLDWHVADVGDYNGDGRADILWRNDDGRLTDWLGSANGGFTPNSANAYYGVPLNWHVVAHEHFAFV